jgi:molybdenum cofactor cytidylyltransferase
MTIPINRAAILLLASGLSRRYGRRDKLLASLGHKPLIEHSARALAALPALARVAVCPSDRPDLRDRLHDRFVIALNKKPKLGLGHSIAVGVQVALQFKPDAIVVCMGDMPFIEPWLIDALLRGLADDDIVHAGAPDRMHPPTAFGPACFPKLSMLDGDEGAKKLIGQGGLSVGSLNAPAPLLIDVDTREELAFAERQLAVRRQYEPAPADEPLLPPPPPPIKPPPPAKAEDEEPRDRRRVINARIS